MTQAIRYHCFGRPRGFTLMELMVSIALALILILGINQVFRIASSSVGAGQALSDNVRDNRAVQTVLYNDLAQAIIRSPDSPCFIIRSSRATAFLDRKDLLSSRAYAQLYAVTPDPTPFQVDGAIRVIDLDANNVEGETSVPGEIISRNDLESRRNFRQDVMCFFIRHLYPRQTGGGHLPPASPGGTNVEQYVADMTCNEAYVWYGHVRQPMDQFSAFSVDLNPGIEPARAPGSGTPPAPNTENDRSNPNNFFARQWGLGRVAVMLQEPVAVPDGSDTFFKIFDRRGIPQWYHCRRTDPPADPMDVTPNTSTAPLSGFAAATSDGRDFDPGLSQLQYSRYDLAGTSIDQFRQLLADMTPPPPTTNGGPIMANPNGWFGPANLTPRFSGYPYPMRPISPFGAARTVPWLVGGCTNFIVEFAGDFVNQDPVTGAISSDYSQAPKPHPTTPGVIINPTDGRIDYIIDPNPGPASTPAPQRVRWYGFPRDVSGTTVPTIGRPDGRITPVTAANANSPDVLPLRDTLGFPAPCEHFINLPQANNSTDYMDLARPASQPEPEYTVAWQPVGTYENFSTTGDRTDFVGDPPRPRMLRVTMTIDDPTGRLPTGQTYEYVVDLP